MNSKKLFKGAGKGIGRKLFLLAGLFTLILCFAFFACGPFEDEILLNKTSTTIPLGDVDYIYITEPANTTASWSKDGNINIEEKGGGCIIRTSGSSVNVEATVTAKSGTSSASCSVRVSESPGGTQVASVAFNQSDLTIQVGLGPTLTSTISPSDANNKAVFYTSSNPSVARVDSTSGKVTAVSEGSAVITVTTKNKGRSDTLNITVVQGSSSGNPDDGLLIISLDKEELTLDINGTATLTAKLDPSTATNSITWSSDKTDVATVSNGLVTAKSAGIAIITAKAGPVEASCTVTVNDSGVTSLSLRSGLNMPKGKTVILTATGAPANTSLTWDSTNKSVATVTGESVGGSVTALTAGTTTITVKTTDGTKTASCIVTVYDDPANKDAFYGNYTGKYTNSSSKTITETIKIANGLISISDDFDASNPDYLDFSVDKWEIVTTPTFNQSANYPYAFKITGKITDAKPVITTNPTNIYGSQTAPGFTQSDINSTTCWMYIYISNTGDIIRSPFSKDGKNNGTNPITYTSSNTTLRVFTKTP